MGLELISEGRESHLWSLEFKGTPEELQALWLWLCDNDRGFAMRAGRHGCMGQVDQETEVFAFSDKRDAAMCKLTWA